MTQLQPITEPLHPDDFDDIEVTDQDRLLHYESHSVSVSTGTAFYCESPIHSCCLQGRHNSIYITNDIQSAFIQVLDHGLYSVYFRPRFESQSQPTTMSAFTPTEFTDFLQSVPIWPRE